MVGIIEYFIVKIKGNPIGKKVLFHGDVKQD